MSDSLDTLKGLAQQIRNATLQGENTAERVGRVLEGTVQAVEDMSVRNKGYFTNSSKLTSAYPSAQVGDQAYVGTSYPYAIWRWNGSAWEDTGGTGGDETLKLNDYSTKEETQQAIEDNIDQELDAESERGIANGVVTKKINELGAKILKINRLQYSSINENKGIYYSNGRFSDLIGYNVYEYKVVPNSILVININTGGVLVDNWAVVAAYNNDGNFIGTLIRGGAGTNKFSYVINIEDNVYILKLMCQPYFMTSGQVTIENLGINGSTPISIVQELGTSETAVMSQKAVTNKLNDLKNYHINQNILSSFNLLDNKGAVTIQGDIVHNDSWGGSVYEVNIQSPCVLSIDIDATYSYSDFYSYASIFSNEALVKTLIRADSQNKRRSITVYIPNGDRLLFMSRNLNVNIIEAPITVLSSDSETLQNINSIISLPKKIYDINHDTNALNFISRLYIEGIAKIDCPSMTIGNEVSLPVVSNNNKLSFTVAADGYFSDYREIDVISSDGKVAQNKKIRPMLVGDSLTDNGYPALCEAIFKIFNDEYGNISPIFIGTKKDDLNIKLGDYQYECRGCNEGRSGWLISSYIRHFTNTYAGIYGWGIESSFLTGKVAWDSLGLATKTRNGVPGRAERQDYVSWNDEIGSEIRNTCHGYYDADPSEELWKWIVNTKGLKTFNYDSEQYSFSDSYTTADDEKQKLAIKYLCENPENPFFDINTVNSSNGSYAFNMEVYLNRYKTIEDNTINRLDVGSTAGSKVRDVNAYDVSTPTHIAIIMTENEFQNNSDGNDIGKDLVLISNLIYSYSNAIKIALGVTRRYGTFNVRAYKNFGYLNLNRFYIANFALQANEYIKSNTDSNHYDILPIYELGSVIGKVEPIIDTLDLKERYKYIGSDYTHAIPIYGYIDRAYSVAAWILSTLN